MPGGRPPKVPEVKVLEDLTEEEAALWCILQDISGIDQGEFTTFDPDSYDGCWRAWPFQYHWLRCDYHHQVNQTARAVGKTLSIVLRMFAFPFLFPGQEAVVTAPQLVHLEPLTKLIERRFQECRLGREMMPEGRSAITHRPLMMNFKNNARIMGRLPQSDGKGVKGIHPIWLELDEACLPQGTMILTEKGLVDIVDLRPGDRVWTHKNRWRPVLSLHSAGVRETVRLVGQGLGGPKGGLRVTRNHRLWAQHAQHWRRGGFGWEWIPAEEMADQYWASPLDSPPTTKSPCIPLSPTNVKRPVDHLDPLFLFLMGVWIAEGSVSSSVGGGPINRATWSVTPDEAVILKRYFDLLGLYVSVNAVQNTDECVNVVLNHSMVARWLTQECGKGAHAKQIPQWVFRLSDDLRGEVLRGVIFGDGDLCKDERYAPGRWRLTTTSKRLMVGSRLLAQGLGYHVSTDMRVPSKDGKIRGKPVKSGVSYVVTGGTAGEGYDVDNEFRLTKVRRVVPDQPVEVFDLTVEEDSSFVADGIVVHNSDYPDAGWTELIETLKRGHEGAVWRASGVTKGIQDKFWEFTQDTPDNNWKVWRITAMSRPNWTDEERAEKIQLYKSRENPDYRRNILGKHGDKSSAIFVQFRLMACCDDNLSSVYNVEEYQHYHINHEQLVDRGQNLEATEFLSFPATHRDYKQTWVGQDVGLTSDPSEILVFGEVRKGEATTLKLLTRIHLERISAPQQGRVIRHVINFYHPNVYAMDSTGLGLPIFQYLQEEAPNVLACIKGYNFSEKILVDFDENAIADMREGDDDVKEAGIFKYVLEESTDALRTIVDKKCLQLPWDIGLIAQFLGQTVSNSKGSTDAYGRHRRVFSEGEYHCLDAARMAILGYSQFKIEQMMKARRHVENAPVFDYFISADGGY